MATSTPGVSGSAAPGTASATARPLVWSPFALAGLIVTTATGVLLVAIAYHGARLNRSWADALFWVGLLVVFLPVAFRLTGRQASRDERMWLVIVVGLGLYAVKVLLEPNAFGLHDELGQFRSAVDIVRTGRLYTKNPVVPAYSFYPGLVSATAALSRFSGLGIFTSGVVILAVARVLLVGGLFLLVERVSDSPRIAGLAVLVYAANPNFVFFDSQFSYESLALGLGVLILWSLSRTFDGRSQRWGPLIVAAVLDASLILTHHLTSYVVCLVVLVWALFELVRRRSVREAGPPLLLAGLAAAATAAYAVWSWPETESDIGGSITSSINGLVNVVTGQTAVRHPYSGAAGYTNPLIEQIVGIASVALLLVALPWGLYALWRRRPSSGGLLILGLCGVLYPLTLALRLTSAGSETSNRASEFVFVGLGAMLAVAFVARLGSRAASRRISSLPWRLGATLYLGVVFAGGITVGNPLYELLPGSFQVAASNRSVDSEGVLAARWASRLGVGQAVLGDENDEVLASAYTRLKPVRGTFAGTGIGELFTSPRLGPLERLLIRYFKLRYLIVDTRDSTALPADGHYFEGGDPRSAYKHPIALRSLTKFSSERCVEQLFASDHVEIFDTQRILDGCR